MKELVILIILTSLAGCTFSGGKLQVMEYQKYNYPSQFIISMPEENVREKILRGFTVQSQKADPYYEENGFKSADSKGNPRYLLAESSSNKSFGKKFFLDESKNNSIYIHTMGQHFLSSHYFEDGEPVSYLAKFEVSIKTKRGTGQTIVSVDSFDSVIGYGKEFNGHTFSYISTVRKVPPAKTEEYKVLVYIAKLLGIKLEPLSSNNAKKLVDYKIRSK